MIKKLISCLMVILFFNLLLPQTNTNSSPVPTSEIPPTFSTALNNWVLMGAGNNFMLLKKNNPFYNPSDVYISTVSFMSKLLQENQEYKTNETKYTNIIAQYVQRRADDDARYNNLLQLYNVGQSKMEVVTNKLAYIMDYVGYQETTINKLYANQKWGLLGNVLLFMGGVILGGLVMYAGFSIANTVK